MMNDRLSEKLKNLPDHPGVYIMKDAQGVIIYVGKAISLKNRVRQYFHSPANHDIKVRNMVPRIEDLDYIITDSELEALALESNLIKKHMPRFNILLKDDKHYPYIKINTKESYPRVEVVRKLGEDDARYFGPYISISQKMLLEELESNFPMRTCKKDIEKALKRKERPCLNYHMGRCLGPCAGYVDEKEYQALVNDVCLFLSGKLDDTIKNLKGQMEDAAGNLEFEKAAVLRNRITALENLLQKQKAIEPGLHDRDVFALAREKDTAVIHGFFVRQGKLLHSERYIFEEVDGEDDAEIWEAFLNQYYASAPQIPREILVPSVFASICLIEEYLSQRAGHRVHILIPQRGEKKKLLEMASNNARDAITKHIEYRMKQYDRNEGAQLELYRILGIEGGDPRMEAFDISNIQGTDSVASMVVFIDGKPQNKEYRRFKIKTVEGADDFASMHEVVLRRLLRAKSETASGSSSGFAHLPGLIIIDGGKGQLHAAMDAMNEAGFTIPMIGLAKRLEEIFLPGQEQPLILNARSPALHLLERIRDEAHRFAITYHRSLRTKGGMRSELEGIQGIGPKKRAALMRHFQSSGQICNTGIEELRSIPGMDIRSAKAVFAHFHAIETEGRVDS